MALDALRARCLNLFGSDERIVSEAFNVLESRGSWKQLEVILCGRHRANLSWRRREIESFHDPGCLWHSPAHVMADGRTPLMTALLATPRHGILSLFGGGSTSALKTLLQKSGSYSLTGVAGGAAARQALAEWQGRVCAALLACAGQDLSLVADNSGRTPLHYAAAAGATDTVDVLLEADAKAHLRDSFGRSPAHVAAMKGHLDLADKLSKASSDATKASQQSDAFGFTAECLKSACEASIDVVSGQNMMAEELFGRRVASGRPLLVRGGAKHLAACSASWADPQHLKEVLGSVQLSTGLIPYTNTRKQTFREFLRGASSNLAEDGSMLPQPYVFDVAVSKSCPQLLRDTKDLLPTDVREQHLAYVRRPQLGIGFRGSGAMLHSHHSAINVLFVGTKRWFLVPPAAAYWSRMPAATWVSSSELEDLRKQGLVVEVMQHAGDVVLVPDGWAHATLIEDYCVGIGQEFIANTSLAS
eukprot:TRINITY_DN26756_c0_g1_i1.p1 TRINITY_DN26756_c0_g1~~TRINITY_DN26756_c0_g1_i1.p1  ORF type:complete len:474 (-),score=76.65 TRINITY_DN26756_c0_g1_i1:18-1439(-)